MNWISFTIPASRNDLFAGLLAISSQRRSPVRGYHCEKGDRVLEAFLDVEGARAAEEIIAGQAGNRIEPEWETQTETGLSSL